MLLLLLLLLLPPLLPLLLLQQDNCCSLSGRCRVQRVVSRLALPEVQPRLAQELAIGAPQLSLRGSTSRLKNVVFHCSASASHSALVVGGRALGGTSSSSSTLSSSLSGRRRSRAKQAGAAQR